MNCNYKKLIIAGRPGSGKTTFLRKIIAGLKSWRGFYTQEIRNEKGVREGFKIVTSEDNKGIIFAHMNFRSPYKVSKYGVDINTFEKVALPLLEPQSSILVIDEIGKMELFSYKFREKLNLILSLPELKLIATTRWPLIPSVEKLLENYHPCLYKIEEKEKIILHLKAHFHEGMA